MNAPKRPARAPVFARDLLLADFGEEGALAFRLSERVGRILNPTAAAAVRLLREGRDAESAARALAERFGADPEAAREDVDALLELLAEERLAGFDAEPEGPPPLPADWLRLTEDPMTDRDRPDDSPPQEVPAIPEEAVPFLTDRDVILREEEEGAFLFEPESGELSCLNPVGILVWQAIDGARTLGAIADRIVGAFEDVDRAGVLDDVRVFLADLKAFGYADWKEPG